MSGVANGLAGVVSKSDVVAIDMGLIPGMDEGEVTGLGLGVGFGVGCGIRSGALRKGDNGGKGGRRFQPPTVTEQGSGQARPAE